ncbi:MAG: efflux RND transporter periplasmic adaptor subunit [Deltaproteobacteria bacterium]|nr:efflux RND transporter periplasmic adaptor subunit [Deltaproteobacteria bacterium]
MTAVSPPMPDQHISQVLGLDGRARRWRRAAWVVVAGVLVAVGSAYAWRTVQGRTARIPGYETGVAERGDLTVAVTATGRLEPANRVQVGAEISGRIAEVKADFNHRVTRGQVLAELDTEQLRIRVDEVRAAVALAKAAVAQADATLLDTTATQQRVEQLHQRQMVSDAEDGAATAALARARAMKASALAQVQSAEAALAAANSALRRAVVRSPISGIVLSRTVERGQTVIAALQAPVLFTIAEDLAQMRLHTNVDEADVGRVREGQRATFTVDAYPGKTFDAVIIEVRHEPLLVQNVVTYDAVLSVANPDLLLRPGMTATASIQTDTHTDVLLVPNAALRWAPATTAQEQEAEKKKALKRQEGVWTVADGVLRRIPVVPGVSDGARTEVVGGSLEEGTPVILALQKVAP